MNNTTPAATLALNMGQVASFEAPPSSPPSAQCHHEAGSELQDRASELTTLAHKLLTDELSRHGNGISRFHSYALWQLVSSFTEQGLQIRTGRYAYALPCGAGKTLSVIAWIAAQYRIGLGLSIAVSAQQIDSLCVIKSGLIEAGVPENQIGIRHTKGQAAAWPDTGEEDRPIMLGSHARIRGKDDMPTFCTHRGAPRSLLIWDESLIASDATTLPMKLTETALAHFADPLRRPLMLSILTRLQSSVRDERAALNTEKPPNTITLISEAESDAVLAELGNPYCSGVTESELLNTARQALNMLKHPVSLLDVGAGLTGEGLMRYRIMVAPELKNIAVLDASFAVRELCKADGTVLDGTSEAMSNFKSYANVCVKQTSVASGHYQFLSRKAERCVAIDAAVESVRTIPTNESVLVFTFKDANDVTQRRLIEAFEDAGIDLAAKLPCGTQRISLSTWGKHTTENSFSHCRHVVLLGVLRMSRLSLAASMAGQKNDLLYRMSNEALGAAELSELASNIMQAMCRGSCRKVDAEGNAHPMTVHLLTKEAGLRELLQRAMRGLNWETINVAAPRQATRTEQAAEEIAAFVLALPRETLKVSKKAIFAATNVNLASAAKAEAMSLAMEKLREHAFHRMEPAWTPHGLSLVRSASTGREALEVIARLKASLGSNKFLMEAPEAI